MVYCFAFRARRYLKISIYKYSPFYTLRNNRVACSSGLSFLSRCFTICEYMYIYIYILICTYTKPFIIRHMFRMSCFYTSLAFAPRSESGRFEQMWGMCSYVRERRSTVDAALPIGEQLRTRFFRFIRAIRKRSVDKRC